MTLRTQWSPAFERDRIEERLENGKVYEKVPTVADTCQLGRLTICNYNWSTIPIVNRNIQKQPTDQFPYSKVEHKDLDGLCLYADNSQNWDRMTVTAHIIEKTSLEWRLFEDLWISLTSLGMSNHPIHPHTVKTTVLNISDPSLPLKQQPLDTSGNLTFQYLFAKKICEKRRRPSRNGFPKGMVSNVSRIPGVCSPSKFIPCCFLYVYPSLSICWCLNHIKHH